VNQKGYHLVLEAGGEVCGLVSELHLTTNML